MESKDHHDKKHHEETKKHHEVKHHEHKTIHTTKQPKKIKKVRVWQYISGLLGVLLILSILTNGFTGEQNIDSMIDSLDSLAKGADSVQIEDSIKEAKDSLIDLKSNLGEVEEKSVDTKKDVKTTSETVKLDFYVMSQCPFGVQVEDGIAPVLKQLGESVDFNLDFIFSPAGNGYRAPHGQTEYDGNKIHLCAVKYYPDNHQYMDLIVCMNKDSKAIPDNWEACATEVGMDIPKLKTCYEGAEGEQLVSESAARTTAIGATGSPTMYINDEPYSGGRTANDFLRALCAEFTDKPDVCGDVPTPKELSVIVLTDSRCGAECDTSRLVQSLSSIFPGMKTEVLDYADSNGKKIYDSIGGGLLPVMLFKEDVKDSTGYSNIERFLQPKGEYYSLQIGAKFDPSAEICDNSKDDTGNGLVDCDDPTCKGSMDCREEVKQQLDVFVMSQCPYGTKALDAMKEVIDNFGDEIDFNVNFIATEQPDGSFSALHGQPEVDENIRELCAIKHYPEEYKYMDYIWCRNKNIQSTAWEGCATEAGMSVEVMKECSTGSEGKALHSENIKIGNSIGISASPTWLANNRLQFSGIDAETVKTNFCSVNPGLSGCGNTLSGDTGAPAGNCG